MPNWRKSGHRPWASRLFGILALAALALAASSLLGACTTVPKVDEPIASVSFDDYRSETLMAMRAARNFQLPDKEAELQWNGPQEWRPASQGVDAPPQKGILLVHGLGDSPWSFHDVAHALAAQGFLVRTVLLPGHGTRPDDLLAVTAEQWQRTVQEQALALENDVDGPVYLGGFSTGANLVLEYAYGHPEIAGLVLFSPGFKSMPFDWVAPLAARVRPWLMSPNGSFPMQTPVRYMNVPTNGYAQFYRTSVIARRLLREQTYDKPVFMVVAQHDSVLDTDYLLDVFQHRFTNPQSRLIWYGTKPKALTDAARILIRGDRLPEQHISQFSHMGLMFSPANPLYGDKGSLRICLNGQAERVAQACEQGVPVWYSDWGYREDGKVHARLTFNPYFDWQTSVMLATLGNEESPRSVTTNIAGDSNASASSNP
ncbi:alpha/beta hydrolase [Marilutibacter chinensis]|uniref:Alpha/beta fold hydrolase n=1 Tax=Marilutibacter chinensis TaxID=2912247 RepID=A0ABS9HQ04_9GAMM|nr:alpha/beta fold hydrolase [Lysobacter chinensis]MCF7220440.1 alpha/beta fold hydrolase [Lysobacter chinensis]